MFSLDVLISCLSKLWKDIIDHILFSISIGVSVIVKGLDDFVINSMLPGNVFETVGSVSVTFMHNIVVNRRF